MKSTRRDALKAFLAVGGTGVLTSCDQFISKVTQELGQTWPESVDSTSSPTIDPAFHLLSRAAFGPWPGDLTRVRTMGASAWIEEQLRPDDIKDPLCELRTRKLEVMHASSSDAMDFKREIVRREISRHRFLRAVYSKRQLFEVMVEFWSDHLNINLEKGDCVFYKPSDERDVVRKHALGKFRDLIRASATSPAMLVYLDGRDNKVRKEESDKPNENYGRELLELHTLGVDGGYTQSDVMEVARCLTGWRVEPRTEWGIGQNYHPKGRSWFDPSRHDDGAKTVLGRVIPAGGGAEDLERLLDIVCTHPSTARYISLKLCRRFVADVPPESLINQVAEVFQQSGGDIPSLIRTILSSPEFASSAGQKLKRPFRFVVSAIRLLGADTHAHPSVVNELDRMGHGLFQYPTPDGYPDDEAAWVGTLLWRWNFAMALTGSKIQGIQVPIDAMAKALGMSEAVDIDRLFAWFTGRVPQPLEKEVFLELANALPSDLSPAQKLAELGGIILASPTFQHC
jgi:uncharacterized protein (DUF1800 family)